MSHALTRTARRLYRARVAAVFFLIWAVMPAFAAETGAKQAPERPNILLIVADDLGWTDLHTGRTSLGNGSRFYQTPNIDRLAEQGMAFTSAYANQNCQPSRAALLTGQYAPRNGVYNVGSLSRGASASPLLIPPSQRTTVRSEAITLAETLKAAGYTTAHVGKFHVSAAPDDIRTQHGFDINYGGGAKGDGGPGGHFAIPDKEATGGDSKVVWSFRTRGREMDRFATPYTAEYISNNLLPWVNGNDPKSLVGTPKHLTDADADAAIDFLNGAGTATKPFFLNVAFSAVHTAIRPRPDLAAKYAARGGTATDPRHRNAKYAALIEGMDQAIGRILARLDDPNGDGDRKDSIADKTLVIFVSDNGGFGGSTDNTPLRGSKGMLSEGGIRVPLVARLPGVIAPGSSNNAAVHLIDLYPTLAELAGAKKPDAKAHILDGVSLAGLLRGTQKSLNTGGNQARTSLFWHFPGYLDTRAIPCSVIIKDRASDGKRYKLLYFYENQHYELYNLSDDLSETKNLVAGSAAPAQGAVRDAAEELRADLVAWLARMKPAALTVASTRKPSPAPVPLDKALWGAPRFEGRVTNGGAD